MNKSPVKIKKYFLAIAFISMSLSVSLANGYALTACGDKNHDQYTPTINIGCTGQGNPIVDMSFALIRILSMGVGLLVVASIIVAGIQYSTSQGDPQAAAKAKTRIQSAITALIIYIFAFAILNYVVPSAVFGI